MTGSDICSPAIEPGRSARPRTNETRIDSPHVLGESDSPAAANWEQSPPPAIVGDPNPLFADAPDDVIEQLRSQASQLAQQLRARQAEVDRRQSQLDAQLAILDQEKRSARLWLNCERESNAEIAAQLADRQRELLEREAAAGAEQFQREQAYCAETSLVEEQRREIGGRESKLAGRRRALKRRGEFLTRRARMLAVRRRRLRDWLRRQRQEAAVQRLAARALAEQLVAGNQRCRDELEARQQALEVHEILIRDQLARRAEGLDLHREQLLVREGRLAEAESILAAQQAEVAAARDALIDDRQRFEARRDAEAAAAAEDRRREQEEIAARREAVEKQSQQVDRRRLALEQLQTELRELHRDTLESQLAAEELRLQLSAAAPSAPLATSLSRLRGKLADHFRLVNDDLADQRTELERLREQIAEQFERVACQKREVQGWFVRRQEEIEEQASRLCSREQELESQERQLAEMRDRWQIEREGYRDEIRGLLAEARECECRMSKAA